jgi:uncharacterized UPF0146 family protein
VVVVVAQGTVVVEEDKMEALVEVDQPTTILVRVALELRHKEWMVVAVDIVGVVAITLRLVEVDIHSPANRQIMTPAMVEMAEMGMMEHRL